MKSSRNTARQLFGLTLTLVGLTCWNTLPVHLSGRAVQAATRARATEPTGQAVSRAVANGRIAFGSFVRIEGNAQFDIYTMNPDGSDRKQLTFGQDLESGPVWSPDGTKIAFQRWNSNIPGIFVMNADGSDQRAVASGFHGPAWSPDGLKLAAASDGIYLINVDGSNRTQITQPIDSDWDLDYWPAWSPDGSKITFTRGTECFSGGCETEHLWVVNADGSNPTKLVDSPHGTSAWSPDGTKIIFSKGQNCHNNTTCLDLFVMNPDGSGLTNITNTDGKSEYSPSWQPLAVSCLNAIDCTEFFVRQHYLDFLNRDPDPAGYAGWQEILNNCPTGDTTCDRIHVSSAFFRSPEFQGRGYFVYRFYPVSFGRKPDYDEFTPDLAKVSGFLTNAELEVAKLNFIAEFMNRPAFLSKFTGLSNTEFVDALLSTADITHPSRNLWIAALTSGSRTRAQVLREIAESGEVYNKYYNQAFVVMQYFGYLRRQPDALYFNWIAHLDSTGDYRSMIHGFMNSPEYRARFGAP